MTRRVLIAQAFVAAGLGWWCWYRCGPLCLMLQLLLLVTATVVKMRLNDSSRALGCHKLYRMRCCMLRFIELAPPPPGITYVTKPQRGNASKTFLVFFFHTPPVLQYYVDVYILKVGVRVPCFFVAWTLSGVLTLCRSSETARTRRRSWWRGRACGRFLPSTSGKVEKRYDDSSNSSSSGLHVEGLVLTIYHGIW